MNHIIKDLKIAEAFLKRIAGSYIMKEIDFKFIKHNPEYKSELMYLIVNKPLTELEQKIKEEKKQKLQTQQEERLKNVEKKTRKPRKSQKPPPEHPPGTKITIFKRGKININSVASKAHAIQIYNWLNKLFNEYQNDILLYCNGVNIN
jgi:hypothetical protein